MEETILVEAVLSNTHNLTVEQVSISAQRLHLIEGFVGKQGCRRVILIATLPHSIYRFLLGACEYVYTLSISPSIIDLLLELRD